MSRFKVLFEHVASSRIETSFEMAAIQARMRLGQRALEEIQRRHGEFD